MHKQERQKQILQKLNSKSKANLGILAKSLGVSYDSIRRDVIELEDKGLLKKIHGGVVSNAYFNQFFNIEQNEAPTHLKIIIKKALGLIKPKQSILMDGGTSNIYLAKQLPKTINLSIITNNLPLAMVLNEHKNINVILIGGRYFKRYYITYGAEAINEVENLNADLYFMGVNGVHPSKGISVRNYEDSLLKKAMIKVSKKVYCLAIDEKINQIETYKVCDIKQLDGIISNLKKDHPNFNDLDKGILI